MSKALTILHYDHDKKSPVLTQLALRAWMCWRAADPPTFWAQKIAHRRWWESEVGQLCEDIRALGESGGKTGSEAVDALIGKWCPDAFRAG